MRWVKRRYLALKTHNNNNCSARDIVKAVQNMIFQLFGEVGYSKTSISTIRNFVANEFVVIRCSNIALGMVRQAITAVNRIGGNPATIQIIGISGTLKGLEKKLNKLQM